MGLGDSIKRLTASLGLSKDIPAEAAPVDISRLQESDSESELDLTDSSQRDDKLGDSDGNESSKVNSEEDSEDEDVDLEDAEIDDDADVVPYQKTTINNRPALQRAMESIQLPLEARKNFVEQMSVDSTESINLRDVYDDTERELAFYKQALEAATTARKQLRSAGVAFSRPTDYFAEMVKSDEHMQRVKKKLVDEETTKKASQEARRQRELRKFGKKVQHERLQERQAEKRRALDRITGLKKKRQGNQVSSDQFDVEIEDALTDKKEQHDAKYKLGNQRSGAGKPNGKRMAKNSRYGSGGRKRGMKRNSSESSMDVSGFSNKRKKF